MSMFLTDPTSAWTDRVRWSTVAFIKHMAVKPSEQTVCVEEAAECKPVAVESTNI